VPRNLAAEVLEDVLYRKRPLEQSFSDWLGRIRLDGRDRALSYQLISTTLRRLGQVDDLIGWCLDRPLPKKAAGAVTILRLGITQLFFLNVPAYAAINTSVDLAKDRRQGPYKRMINAILRRLDREGAELVNNQDAAKLNTPAWLWGSWATAYGEKTCRQIAEAHLSQAPLDLSVKEDAYGWAEKLSGTLLATGSIRLKETSSVEELLGFREGAWWVQGAAAALPVKLMGKIKEMKIVDLCAAPGGKTAQLAAAGAKVIAIDKSSRRLAKLEKNMARLKLKANLLVADAVTWRPDSLLDAVLIDAPCTATGNIRRHPDIQHLKSLRDVKSVINIQRSLLDAAIHMVKPGGKIIYAICSLQPDEGPELINTFLASGVPVVRQPILQDEVGGMAEFLTANGDLRTLPCHLKELGGIDGFFVARLIHH